MTEPRPGAHRRRHHLDRAGKLALIAGPAARDRAWPRGGARGEADRGGAQATVRLQGILRQGEPLHGRELPRPGTPGGAERAGADPRSAGVPVTSECTRPRHRRGGACWTSSRSPHSSAARPGSSKRRREAGNRSISRKVSSSIRHRWRAAWRRRARRVPRESSYGAGSTFGYGDLVVDFRGIEIMKRFGCPVFSMRRTRSETGAARQEAARIHPGARRAAVAAGVDGVFIETTRTRAGPLRRESRGRSRS